MNTERNEQIQTAYKEGETIAAIGRKFNLGERQVHSLLSGMRSVGEALRGRPPKAAVRPAISKVHERIGRKLYDFYFNQAYDRRAAANKLGWSLLRLRNVEQGHVDLTLFELQDIAAFMRIGLEDLINGG